MRTIKLHDAVGPACMNPDDGDRIFELLREIPPDEEICLDFSGVKQWSASFLCPALRWMILEDRVSASGFGEREEVERGLYEVIRQSAETYYRRLQRIYFDYKAWEESDKAFDHEEFDLKLEKAFESGEPELVASAAVSGPFPPFKPSAHYCPDGDTLEVHLTNEPCYFVWICPDICVIRSQESNQIIGVSIDGLSRIVADAKARWDDDPVQD